MKLKLKIKKLDPDIKTPSFAHHDDAAMDLCSRERFVIPPGEKVIVPTGIAVEIPEGYAGLVWDKGSLGVKYGLKTLGGVVDAGYRGEIAVGIINLSKEEYILEKNHKVAQMIIQKIEQPEIEIVSELSESTRGEGRFGSTGK